MTIMNNFASPSFVQNCAFKVLWTPGLALTCLKDSFGVFALFVETLYRKPESLPYGFVPLNGPKVALWPAVFSRALGSATDVTTDHGTIEDPCYLGSPTSILWCRSRRNHLYVCEWWSGLFFLSVPEERPVDAVNQLVVVWTNEHLIHLSDPDSVTITEGI